MSIGIFQLNSWQLAITTIRSRYVPIPCKCKLIAARVVTSAAGTGTEIFTMDFRRAGEAAATLGGASLSSVATGWGVGTVLDIPFTPTAAQEQEYTFEEGDSVSIENNGGSSGTVTGYHQFVFERLA